MLCAKLLPELDAVEAQEVGLSIASPEEQPGAVQEGKAARKRELRAKPQWRNACVRVTQNPMKNTSLTPVLR